VSQDDQAAKNILIAMHLRWSLLMHPQEGGSDRTGPLHDNVGDNVGECRRNSVIDSLRAIALAGVIIMNMMTFSGLAYLTPEMRVEWLGTADNVGCLSASLSMTRRWRPSHSCSVSASA